MLRPGSQLALLGLLLAGCVAAIVFIVLSFEDGGRRREQPAMEREERSYPEQPPIHKQPKAAEQPVDPVEEEEGPGEQEEPEPESSEERTGTEPIFLGELAELALELLRPKEDEQRGIGITVTDESGAPLDDVLVVLRQGEEIVYRARTDEQGVMLYQPYVDEEGPFRIDAITPYYSPGTESDVKPGDVRRIQLIAQPWIEGRVQAPSQGLGVVTLWTRTGKRTTGVESDGTFAFFGLDPGWFTVSAEVDPYGSDEESFELAAGTRQWVNLKVRVRERVRIFGDIGGWPKTGGKVWINGVEVAVTAKGRYIFEKALIGLNEIVIDAPEQALFKDRFTVEGRKKSKYDFEFRPAGSIRGSVRSAKDRTRVEGAEVRVGIDYNDPQNDDAALFPIERVPLAYTDPKGQFEIDRLELGTTYLISIVKHPHAQFLGRFTAKALGVHTIELPSGPFVYGRLKGLGGIPHHATVTARRLIEKPDGRMFNVPDWDLTRSGRDNKGFYGLSGLLPDLYLVRAEAPGFGSMETVLDLRDGREGRMDFRIRRGQADRIEDAELLTRLPPIIETGEEVAVGQRGNATVLTIDAARADNEIPLPGVNVRFFEGDIEYSAPISFREEKFELVGLPEATYRAILTHPLLDKPIIVDNVRLVRGEPQTIKLRERKE